MELVLKVELYLKVILDGLRELVDVVVGLLQL